MIWGCCLASSGSGGCGGSLLRLLFAAGLSAYRTEGSDIMKRAVSCREMKALDEYTISGIGIPSCVLMERAALCMADELGKTIAGRREQEKILCVCGAGNNGGDGVAAARILKLRGYDAAILMAGNPEHRTEETSRQLAVADRCGVSVVNNPDWDEYTTIVDALFGIGLTRPIEGEYRELILRMNQSDAFKAAVDIPSGVNGDTGQVMGCAFLADLTVTFACRKAGLCLYPGKKLAGRVVAADIGIYGEEIPEVLDKKPPFYSGTHPAFCNTDLYIPEPEDLYSLPPRDAAGNKGTFGKALVVAGSPGMCGAAYLSAAAALGAGAGMVRILTPPENRIPLQTLLPEAILTCSEDEDDFEMAYRWCDLVVLGPGLSIKEESAEKAFWFLERSFFEKKPLILDADGLNLLSAHPEWQKFLGSHVILTPHIIEMSRLTGKTAAAIQADRICAARELSCKTGSVCVLKDACTVTASPDGTAYLNLSGNPGMATAGSGDVLSGILAGTALRFLPFSYKKTELHRAVAAAVYLHGAAGDLAAQKIGVPGMKAGDILRYIPEALKKYDRGE